MLRRQRLVISATALSVAAASLWASDAVIASTAAVSTTTVAASMTDWETFQAQSAAIANEFTASQQPAISADPDPASTISLHPELERVQNVVDTIAPGSFAGAYLDNGVVRIGLSGGAGLLVGLIQAALPGVPLVVFNAPTPWTTLLAATDDITQLMSSQPAPVILSARPDVVHNVVSVGVSDVNAPAATALVARYGNVVSLFQDEPVELAVDPVAPGRDSRRDPVLGGVNITSPSASCTSGFDYGPPIRQDPTGLGQEKGVITAGHCFEGQLPTTEWRQGGSTLGTFTRTRFVNGSQADAGTITTRLGILQFRGVTNQVFIASGAATVRITRRLARTADRPAISCWCPPLAVV